MRSTRPSRPRAIVGGKYRLRECLAIGGMGEVWVARNEATGADVAVKFGRGPEVAELWASRAAHEARLGAMLSHRGIVRIFDLVEEPEATPILVMELLRGETLAERLRRVGVLPTETAMAIALSVLSALAHAHDLGIVHRDITPSNIFLAVDPDGRITPKLLDFGIAKRPQWDPRTVEGRVLGTPQYMSPEQIRDPGAIDGRSDVYSLAVVLYEALTGTCPFAAGSASASLAAVLEVVVDPDLRIEPEVWIELRRALSKRVYERHANAREFANGLALATGKAQSGRSELVDVSMVPPEADSVERQGPTTSVGVVRTRASQRIARRAWAGGALIAAALVAAGTVAIGRARNGRPATVPVPAQTTAHQATAPVGDAAPKGSATAASADLSATAASSASVRSPTPPPPATNPVRPRREKAVATTPGF
jgi:serine/threonine-protein kinase